MRLYTAERIAYHHHQNSQHRSRNLLRRYTKGRIAYDQQHQNSQHKSPRRIHQGRDQNLGGKVPRGFKLPIARGLEFRLYYSLCLRCICINPVYIIVVPVFRYHFSRFVERSLLSGNDKNSSDIMLRYQDSHPFHVLVYVTSYAAH